MNDTLLPSTLRNELETLIENSVRKVLSEIKQMGSPTEADKPMTVPQAAAFLSLTVPTIYDLIHDGKLSSMQRSKRCYFFKEDLINYLKAGRRKTSAEISKEAEEFIQKRKQKETNKQ